MVTPSSSTTTETPTSSSSLPTRTKKQLPKNYVTEYSFRQTFGDEPRLSKAHAIVDAFPIDHDQQLKKSESKNSKSWVKRPTKTGRRKESIAAPSDHSSSGAPSNVLIMLGSLSFFLFPLLDLECNRSSYQSIVCLSCDLPLFLVAT